jgi:hypothetical protein
MSDDKDLYKDDLYGGGSMLNAPTSPSFIASSPSLHVFDRCIR